MDFKPQPAFKGNSFGYRKKRCIWFNSAFTDDFTLNDGKIIDMTFNVPPFQIYNTNNLKVICYIRDDTNAKPIVIKMKEPYLTTRSVINTDKEGFPLIYCNHTGHEGMTSMSPKFTLIPQQIPRFIFKADENFTPIFSAYGNTTFYQVFSYTGAIQTFTIPGGVSSVNIYCWGAGGGSSKSGTGTGATRGGNGGFVKATLEIPSGTTSLGIIVGQGGAKGVYNPSGLTRTAFGGGGAGADGDSGSTGWALAGGGGLSGVFINDANFTIVSSYYVNTSATAILIAGGGGGAGAYDSAFSGDTFGGNGGSTTANDGTGNRPGGGGTQSAGGTAGTVNGYAQGTAGSKYLGGNGTASSFNPGGGGGFYGGGAGGVEPGKVSGGGGGSSFINTNSYKITNITNLKNENNGTSTAPGNTETYYQTAIALGGLTATSSTITNDGANGLVVIEYFAKRNDGLTPNETLIQTTTTMTITKNSKYSINYQTPIKIPNGSYSSLFSQGAITFGPNPNYDYPTTLNNPYIWYKFDDAQFLYDSSSNAHLINAGATLDQNNFKRGNSSLAVSQNKVAKIGGYINLNSLQIANGLSFSVWFRATNASQYGRVFEFFNGAPETYSVIMDFPNSPTTNNLRIYTYENGTYVNYTTSSINFCDGSWRHIVWSISSTGVWSFYINGVNQNINITANIPNSLDLNNQKVLGGSFDGASSYMTGNIDDFRIYNYVLTPNDIYDLYNGNSDRSYPILKNANGATINPLAWYKFDGSTTGLVIDSSGNDYNLWNSNATFNMTTFAKGNGSISFNGSSQYITNRTFCNLNGISFSISLWCYSSMNTYGTFNILGSIGEILSSSINDYNYLQIGNFDGRWSFGGIFNPSATQIQEQNNWVHLVYTFNSVGANKQEILYRNGSVYHSVSTKTANWNFPNQIIEIGRRTLTDSRSYWLGHVDDFRIYPLELSNTQVSELYNGRLSIYNPPSFELGVELEDTNLTKDNIASIYR